MSTTDHVPIPRCIVTEHGGMKFLAAGKLMVTEKADVVVNINHHGQGNSKWNKGGYGKLMP